MNDTVRDIDVVVISDDGELTRLVVNEIESRGKTVIRFNLGDVRSSPLVVEPGDVRVQVDGGWCRLDIHTTAWWHRAGRVEVGGLTDDEARLAVDECPHVLVGGLSGAGVRWVDDPMDVERAELKLHQLKVVSALGVATPPSMVTNDVPSARRFETGHRTVSKPLSPGFGIAPFVAEIEPGDVELVQGLPALLQELQTHATADLRVVVVGSQAWVWRRKRGEATIDWRAEDPNGAGFLRIVDDELTRAAIRTTAALKLSMSVQDWLETPDVPVFLEANPQGAWLFLPDAAAVVLPALADHLLDLPVAVEGVWPSTFERFLDNFLPANSAPENDGVRAPVFSAPSWAAEAAAHPEALDVARRAHDVAKSGALSAEEKAGRLLNTTLALLTIALAVGSFQLSFVFDKPAGWWLSALPIVLAVTCLCLAAFESGEIDRVGMYGRLTAESMTGNGARDPLAAVIAEEELGRRLAKWTSDRKHTDLMQARAWFSRGLAALVVAALVAGVCRAVSAESDDSPTTTTVQPSASTTVATSSPTTTSTTVATTSSTTLGTSATVP
ncbi:MAG: ATP-grasp domain-containing protein [Rhodococcus sp. (in: high G+C Gram-positive bacteria)]